MEGATRSTHSLHFKMVLLRQIYALTILPSAFDDFQCSSPFLVDTLGRQLFGDFDHISIVFFELSVNSDSVVILEVAYIF